MRWRASSSCSGAARHSRHCSVAASQGNHACDCSWSLAPKRVILARMSQPEIALLMSTFERPRHLRLALESIARQSGVEGRMELVVTDDGSTDETPEIVRDFAASVNFPVEFTTHPHTTFQLARGRNEGVRASRAPYILFLDGD